MKIVHGCDLPDADRAIAVSQPTLLFVGTTGRPRAAQDTSHGERRVRRIGSGEWKLPGFRAD